MRCCLVLPPQCSAYNESEPPHPLSSWAVLLVTGQVSARSSRHSLATSRTHRKAWILGLFAANIWQRSLEVHTPVATVSWFTGKQKLHMC
uniref:Secreted protein n=1 Tax=Pyxicephalus adspersus TaxID=30357 RepID=A0AAV3AUT0_PYXAD|nr:TPA: hypothetical protein GDO54_008371 [Pyxicephalus adspersus]